MESCLDNLLKQEETWWAQRAKVHWLQQGDLNTRFFHHKASQRNGRNHIYIIQDARGNIWKDSDHIHSIFLDYFQNIFSSNNHSISLNSLSMVKNRISTFDYELLNKVYTEREVFDTIRSLKSNSAAGPNGISTLFYQQYWDIIGTDILEFVLNILNNGGSVSNINHILISDQLAYVMLFSKLLPKL